MKNPLGSLFDLVQIVGPLDLQTARSGDYISLKNAAGVLFVVIKGVGTAADDPLFTIRQATAVAGTAVKDAVVIDTIYKKQGADLVSVGTWTKVTQTAAATFQADATSAEEMAIYAIWVPADALDSDNGFDCVTMNVADVGVNAQLGTVLAIVTGLRYNAAPENLKSLIID